MLSLFLQGAGMSAYGTETPQAEISAEYVIDNEAGYEAEYEAQKTDHGMSFVIRSFSAAGSHLTYRLPEEIDGTPVTAVTSGSLSALMDHVSTLVIPAGIAWIEEGAFRNLELEKIELENPDGRYAVTGSFFCDRENQAILLHLPEYPGKVVTVPKGTASIGAYAFAGNESLTRVILPDSLVTLGEGAFRGCLNLERALLPAGLKNVGAGCFAETALKHFEIKGDSDRLEVKDGVLYRKGGKVLLAWPCGKDDVTCSVPEDVMTVQDGAFAGARNLRAVHLPESLSMIGRGAFENCRKLRRVSVPDSCSWIGPRAFYGCVGLVWAGLSADSALTGISEQTFALCSSLQAIQLPAQTGYIGFGAFEGCESLTGIVLPDSLMALEAGAFKDCRSLRELNIPPRTSSIGEDVFAGDALLTLLTAAGSEGETYAKENGLPFRTQKAVWEEGRDYTDTDTVMRVQQALTDLGYAPGKTDGLIGRKTRAAIAQFRKERNLPEGEAIDADVLNALGLDPAGSLAEEMSSAAEGKETEEAEAETGGAEIQQLSSQAGAALQELPEALEEETERPEYREPESYHPVSGRSDIDLAGVLAGIAEDVDPGA